LIIIFKNITGVTIKGDVILTGNNEALTRVKTALAGRYLLSN